MSAAIAQKLDEARALIEKGWTQGAMHSRTLWWDNYCSVGALQQVGLVGAKSTAPYYDARDFLCAAICTDNITDWNDAPERTQAEVIEAFRKAAELARGEQS